MTIDPSLAPLVLVYALIFLGIAISAVVLVAIGIALWLFGKVAGFVAAAGLSLTQTMAFHRLQTEQYAPARVDAPAIEREVHSDFGEPSGMTDEDLREAVIEARRGSVDGWTRKAPRDGTEAFVSEAEHDQDGSSGDFEAPPRETRMYAG